MVLLSGGEPLMHPDIASIVDELANRGGMRVNVSTNGKLIDAKMARQLDAVNLTSICVSMESPSRWKRVGESPCLGFNQSVILPMTATPPFLRHDFIYRSNRHLPDRPVTNLNTAVTITFNSHHRKLKKYRLRK